MHPLSSFHHCPRCGAADFCEHDARAKHCAACGFTYYYNSAASVAAFILNERGELLTIRRRLQPAAGTLDLPGGFVDPGEGLLQAVRREVREETGVEVTACEFLFSFPNTYCYSDFDVATTDAFFLCRVPSHVALHANDDAADAAWCALDAVQPEAFGLQSIRRGVERFLQQHKHLRAGEEGRKKKSIEEMHRLDVETFRHIAKRPVVLLLDNVRSQHNVGACFRTADAFALQEVVLCGITCTPPSTEIHKTALGAEESVAWRYFPSTQEAVAALRAEGFRILAVEQAAGSVDLFDFPFQKHEKYALVVGNEVYGVEQDVVTEADAVLEIPQYGTKHSLNVSVTAGIVCAAATNGK